MHPADALTERLGIPIRDRDLLAQALVHSSWLHEHPDSARGHNERLEFLGDSVVSLAVSEALYRRHPTDDEGILSARRASIVSTPGLARLAARLDLGSFLLLGEGEAMRGGRVRPSLLASAFEALVGAIYLDQGWDVVRDWIHERAREELLGGSGTDQPQEPQEPAPGAHPAVDRRTTRLPAARGGRPGSREALPDRGGRRWPDSRCGRRFVATDRGDVCRRRGPGGAPPRARGREEPPGRRSNAIGGRRTTRDRRRARRADPGTARSSAEPPA